MKHVLSLLIVALFATGCAPSATRAGPLSPRCASLSDRAAVWGAVGVGSGAVGGAGGLASLPMSDASGRLAIGVTSVVLAAVSIAAGFVSKNAVESFALECK